MNETISGEAQLIRAYEVVFQALLNGFIVAGVILFIAAIVLIILCCRELKQMHRLRDAEPAAAYEEGLKCSGLAAPPKQSERPPEATPIVPTLYRRCPPEARS